MECWGELFVVPIIIGKRERFWEVIGALFSYLLSQYSSWIGNWGTAGDALRPILMESSTTIKFHTLRETGSLPSGPALGKVQKHMAKACAPQKILGMPPSA